jgi:IMP dehydrogenase
MTHGAPEEAYSFDDVLLLPNFSDVLPSLVETRTRLSRNIDLNIPLVTAAMDTVTEAKMAISMAREGGIGFIHRNLSIKNQCREVEIVKKSESGMIINPITTEPDVPIRDVLQMMEQYHISGVPVTKGDKLVGIVTNRDLRFETNLDKQVSDVMTKEDLVTVQEGIGLEESK